MTDEGGKSDADLTPIPSGRIKVGNVTVELELMVTPQPTKQLPEVRKLLSLPEMVKLTGVFKVMLTNEDVNDPLLLVLSMEFAPVLKTDPARLKNISNVEFHIIPGVADDAVKLALAETKADAMEVGLAILKNTMSS